MTMYALGSRSPAWADHLSYARDTRRENSKRPKAHVRVKSDGCYVRRPNLSLKEGPRWVGPFRSVEDGYRWFKAQ